MLFFSDDILDEQAGLVRYVTVAGVIAGLMCLYRLVVTLVVMADMYNLEIWNSAFAVAALASVSLWCLRYSAYRTAELNHIKDYKVMKYVSLLAAVCCLLRAVTAGIYFSIKMDGGSAITYIYVVADVVLWIVLALFFVEMWGNMRRRQREREELKARELGK